MRFGMTENESMVNDRTRAPGENDVQTDDPRASRVLPAGFISNSCYRYSNELGKEMEGKNIWMRGWIHDTRNLGGIAFILLRDRYTIFQATVIKKMNKDLFKAITVLPRESVIAVHGQIQFSEKVRNGFELLVNDFKLITKAETPLPLGVADMVEAEMDTRFDNRFLDLRKPEVAALFSIRSSLVQAIRTTLCGEGFMEVNTPKVVATATEGGTELFHIRYFEKDAYLNQSPQLYKQMLMATGFDRVFEIAPAFRAEKHDTIHHLNEFISLDIEMAFATMPDVTGLLERVIKAIYREVLEKNDRELELLGLDTELMRSITKATFPVVTYTECIERLKKKGFEIAWGEDLSMDATKQVARDFEHFYFITDWPTAIKPFYVLPKEGDEKVCHAFDLMYKEEELTSGAQRVHEHELLTQRLREQGLDPKDFESYLKPFRYGMPYHSGWGFGVDRTLMVLTGQKNIRECVLFPRDRYRLEP